MSTRGDPHELPAAPRPRGATRVVPPEPAARAGERTRPVRVARFANAAIVVLCLVGSVQMLVLIGVEVQRLRHTEREVARLESEIIALDHASHDLLEIAGRAGDAGYREQLARRQGYVFAFETRFVGPRSERVPVDTNPDTNPDPEPGR